jgi:hypothetical protein
MNRIRSASAFGLSIVVLAAASSTAFSSPQALVLPLRTLGVSDTTASVVGDLLQGELENRGLAVFPASQLAADIPRGATACDDAACAGAAAQRYGTAQVVYGSLSRLGDKVILRVRALKAGESTPYYTDQLTSTTEEDLDAVVRRVADGLAAGRRNSDRATVETVTQQETQEPLRRATRRGIGARAGFLFPDSDSYAGADRLAGVRLVFKYETRDYFVESTPLLGLMWGDGSVEWSLFDLFAARIFGRGDFSPYLGGGLGVHTVHVEKSVPVDCGPNCYYEDSIGQTETTLTADIGLGLLALRTNDLSIILDVRYHYVLADFDKLGGKGAHGFSITFGTSR